MWEQVKQAMVDSAREGCGSVRAVGKNPKNIWWNDVVKTAIERKEAAWKEALRTKNEVAKESCMETYKEEKRKVKRYIYIRAKRR